MSTPEERAAISALEAAIEAYRVAYSKAHPEALQDGTLIDWLVIAAALKPDAKDPEDDLTTYTVMMAGGSIPWYRAMGLLMAGKHYFTHNVGPQQDQ